MYSSYQLVVVKMNKKTKQKSDNFGDKLNF